MSVQYDQSQPGFIEMRSLERRMDFEGNYVYLMAVCVRPGTLITLDFGPDDDDDNEDNDA